MPERKRFQYYLVTGKATFPVAVIFCLAMTAISFGSPADLLPLFSGGLTAYLLIELNTSFSLIRTRTTFHAALFLLFYASCVLPHGHSTEAWIPFLFVAGIYFLFQSYESPYASTPVYHSFLFLGLTSLIFPYILYVIPLVYIFMLPLRSLNLRSFFAGIIGLATPYWFLLCYHLYTGNPADAFLPFVRLAHPPAIDYSHISLSEAVSGGVLLIFTGISSTFVISKGFQDKVQTRIMLRIVFTLGITATAMAVLIPVHFMDAFSILLVAFAIMNGHLLVLTYNKLTHILSWVISVTWILLTLFNIWTDSFSF